MVVELEQPFLCHAFFLWHGSNVLIGHLKDADTSLGPHARLSITTKLDPHACICF